MSSSRSCSNDFGSEKNGVIISRGVSYDDKTKIKTPQNIEIVLIKCSYDCSNSKVFHSWNDDFDKTFSKKELCEEKSDKTNSIQQLK